MRRGTRKPTKKEILFGCWHLFWDMIISFLIWRFNRAALDWMLFKLTLKGNFEVTDELR